MSTPFSLQQLGWRNFYSQQLTLSDLEAYLPARVASVHRSGVAALCERGWVDLVVPRDMQGSGVGSVLTVGDWVLVDRGAPRLTRRLDRWSAIVRLAAGSEAQPQAIAANIDTLFVVTSCDHDFNPSRLERYMAVALDAGVDAVIVLTKADLCGNPSDYVRRAAGSAPRAEVVALNATLPSECRLLDPWLGSGQTVAFVGSSGVGKSTLVNALTGADLQATAATRADDSRGRHTTTARQLIPMPGDAWLIDTPGMRELKIGAVESGVDLAFAEVATLASECRFRDCGHVDDDGCALRAAVTDGCLEARRLESYLKLQREAARAARALHERRDSERRTGKLYKAIQARRREDRGR
jgi:ribosome biogenesis GTPase / thiamine phosphate phosphatase